MRKEGTVASSEELTILPETRIGDLIERYPQVEDVLIAMAPAFRKLKNPILRRSVGKVASLRQAAAVAGMPVADVVNRLRAEVGQAAWTSEVAGGDAGYFGARPEWFDASKIAVRIDEL